MRGFNRLYEGDRKPAPIAEAVCWAHARPKFFDPPGSTERRSLPRRSRVLIRCFAV